jgi:gluconate 2-dehydrogenase gamma chain
MLATVNSHIETALFVTNKSQPHTLKPFSECYPVRRYSFLVNRREFIKIGVAGAVGFGVASAIEIPLLENQNNLQTSQNQTQTSNLQNQITQSTAFLALNTNERPLVESLAETIIPSDENGPGAKEANVVYFIDHMLAGSYGQSSGKWWYMQGPYVTPQPAGTSLTVNGAVYPSTTKTPITYSNGTIKPRLQAGTGYQYPFNAREFWRRGLVSLQAYCNAAKGNTYEKLSPADQTAVLQELYDNSPTNTALQSAFQAPNAAEFFNDLYDMVVAGFFTDPIYGGNQNMVGWQLIAFNANYWGDDIGLGATKLMTAGTPTRLPPKSLGQFQAEGGGA